MRPVILLIKYILIIRINIFQQIIISKQNCQSKSKTFELKNKRQILCIILLQISLTFRKNIDIMTITAVETKDTYF